MVSTKDRKYEVILDRCAVIDAATAVFRLIRLGDYLSELARFDQRLDFKARYSESRSLKNSKYRPKASSAAYSLAFCAACLWMRARVSGLLIRVANFSR